MTLLEKINSLTWWNEISKVKDILRNLFSSSEDLLTRVGELENSGGGGIQSITGASVDNTDPSNPIINDSRPYLVYTAKLTQTGTNTPIVSILENTFPDTVTWSYVDVGYYTASFENDYFINESDFSITAAGVFVISGTGEVWAVAGIKDDTNAVAVTTRGNLTPGYDVDGVLFNHTVEIRVYN